MRKTKIIVFSAIVLTFLSVLCRADGLSTVSPTSRDIAFSNLLNKEKMYKFSEYFLKKQMELKRPDTDRLKIQLADTYVKMNKIPLANKIINSIPKSSKYYYSAQFSLGKASLERNKLNEGIKYLTAYVKHFHKNLPKKDDDLMQEYKTAVTYLSWAYKQLPNPKMAEKVIKDYMPVETDREGILYGLISKLDAAEVQKNQEMVGAKKNTGWKKAVEQTLAPFEELRWAGPDAITLFSIVQRGRALYMLDKYDDALKEFGKMPEIFVAFEEEFRRLKEPGQSPSAGLRFWIGKTFMKQAEKAKDKKEKVKLYVKALQKFLFILKKQKGYPKEALAYSDLIICIKDLKKLGKNVTIKDLNELKPKGADNVKKLANVMPADAKKYMTAKQYVKAIPVLLDAARKNRINPAVADVLGNLAFAYVNTNQTLEGLAIADYVGKSYPNDKTVPLAILRAAETLWRGKKKTDALYFYEIYLDAAPMDQYASAISTRVAKEHYDRAAAIAKQANKLQGQAKEKKVAEAIAVFKSTIPHYVRIIKNYGNDKKNVDNAYYLMGLSYASAKEFSKAAETFLKAAELQKSPTKLASVKLNAADNYFKGGQNAEKDAKKLREDAYALQKSELKTKKLAEADKLDKDAKKYFKNSVSNLNEMLDKWMVAGGKIGSPKTSKLKKAYESALQLLAWAYDAAGEKKKSIQTFQRFIAKYPKSPKVPACMSRMGILYYELNDYTTSAKVLENLASKFPTSPEAKSAYYNLGRNMYEIGNYTKAFEVFNKIFNQKVEISVANLRWIASNLVNCGKDHPKAGATLSLIACKMLLQRLKTADKDLPSWVGEKMAGELKASSKEKAKTLDIIKQKLLFDAGNAAFYSGDTTKAVAYLDELLANKNTPYFYKAKFARARAYESLKSYDKARQDLGEIALAAMTAKKDSISTQAKTLVGKTYMEQKMYKKAYASFNLISKSLNTANLKIDLPNMTEEQKKAQAKEREEEKYWIEESVYQGACCAAKLGLTNDVKRLQALYKKHFPKGRFIKDIDKMPKPEKANKQ